MAEGQLEAGGDPDEENPAFEPLGTGANTFAYWVRGVLLGSCGIVHTTV